MFTIDSKLRYLIKVHVHLFFKLFIYILFFLLLRHFEYIFFFL